MFVSGKPFQPNLMFVSRAERIILLRELVNYGRRKFYVIGPISNCFFIKFQSHKSNQSLKLYQLIKPFIRDTGIYYIKLFVIIVYSGPNKI